MEDFSENTKGANLNLSAKGGGFLQSLEWEKFQQSFGRKTWRVKGLLVIRHDLPLGFNYLYCPRPVLDENLREYLEEFKKISRREKSIFLKIEPESGNVDFLKASGFVESKREIQPSKTVILDLEKSEEKLLSQTHEKTRYNIRLAQRHEIRIEELNKSDFENIWKIFQTTSARDKFSLHPRLYYEKMTDVLKPSGILKIFGGFFGEKLIAVNLMVFFGKRATYLHGASLYQYRDLMAPYLLHFETIKQAKALGFKEYDFWGISEDKYPGVSRFKKGFGGSEINYPGSFDYVFSPLRYNLYKTASRLKRFL